jgi:methionyl-tRNA synthetase
MPDTSKKILKIMNIEQESNFQKINDINLSGIKLNEISLLFPRVDK